MEIDTHVHSSLFSVSKGKPRLEPRCFGDILIGTGKVRLGIFPEREKGRTYYKARTICTYDTAKSFHPITR